ncbi:SWIM zinc finger family protein [Nanoarchaeota archaeon]
MSPLKSMIFCSCRYFEYSGSNCVIGNFTFDMTGR